MGVCGYGIRSLAVNQRQQDIARSVSCQSFDSTPTTAIQFREVNMSEPIADDQPYATFVYNHRRRQFVDRRCYERLRAILRWIPVEERLPEQELRCLVFTGSDVRSATYYPPGCFQPEITHWMPLPEPPEVK